MEQRLFRAIYAIEFLVALVAALFFWNYVGGPTHLDYVPWPWKGVLSVGVAASVVKMTTATSRLQAVKWIVVLSILVAGCGLLSYYAHVNEPQDEDDSGGQVVPTSLDAHEGRGVAPASGVTHL
jgi:hypothetical protein